MAQLSIFRLSPIVAAAWLMATQACAQTTATQLEPITVTGRTAPPASVGGWGDIPLAKTPLQASVFTSEQLKDSGARRLSDLVNFDPGISDAYNSEGYVDYLTVRGFVIDNRFNYRRDGLPINAETPIPLDNKSRVEILKGTSGMQAGTSAPGGLVNFVVKRPTDAPLRSASLEWRQAGSVTGALDLSQRFGEGLAFGVRMNAAAAHLDPQLKSAKGERSLLALAADWRVSPNTLIEAEVETSRRSQPSQPGLSLLGNTVPEPGDPRLNLNNQPWSLPVVFRATTASLRWQQKLGNDWRFIAHAATQQLRTDDRLAFPYGCTDTDGTYYADRYCPNGTYDLYDFRSENERRRSDALDLSLQGKLQTGPLSHALTVGALRSTVRNRFQQQAYNYVGTGNVAGTLVTPADPSLTDENTDRDERSTELYARDAIALTSDVTAWLGLRHTRLTRESVRTDGSRATGYSQSFNTPWLALSYAFAPDQLVYASWGQGVESEVTPNRPRYNNPGVALPTLKSRQVEVGVKGSSERFEWSLAGFDIERPNFADVGTCDLDNTCTRQVVGDARHRGVEATGAFHEGGLTLRAGAQWLRARLDNGLQPTNVPARTLRLQAAYSVPKVPGLALQANATHESRRMVLPDNSVSIPGYTRVDAAVRFENKWASQLWTWRAGVDNLFDKRGWRESPYQFGHAYLYPLAPRTLRLSVQVDV
jgi:iron complex outermembrane recepter protein